MSNVFTQALKDAGIETTDEFTEWTSFSESRLPFGNYLGLCAEDNTVGCDVLKSHNFFRMKSEPFNISDYGTRTTNDITSFLKENASRCRVLPNHGCRKEYHGYLGVHNSNECADYIMDAVYNYTDIVCYFAYDMQYETFEFVFNSDALNSNNIEQFTIKKDIGAAFDASAIRNSKNGMISKKLFEYCKENIFPKCEFIPIIIHEYDGCVISHRAYTDKVKRIKYPEITSPCLGKNIKKHDDIMNRLQGWIDNGGYIKDNLFYLILEDRRDCGENQLYLRHWKLNKSNTAFID